MSDFITLQSRAAAYFVLATGIVLAVVLLALGVSGLLRASAGDTDAALRQLAIYRAEIAARPAVEAHLKDALARAATTPGLLEAANTSLTLAELQNDFKSLAATRGADIRSADALPPTQTGDFETIAVQYDLSVPMSRLRDLTYAIETHTPYLFIDHVTIGAARSGLPDDPSARDPTLDVRWTIRGYRWQGAR